MPSVVCCSCVPRFVSGSSGPSTIFVVGDDVVVLRLRRRHPVVGVLRYDGAAAVDVASDAPGRSVPHDGRRSQLRRGPVRRLATPAAGLPGGPSAYLSRAAAATPARSTVPAWAAGDPSSSAGRATATPRHGGGIAVHVFPWRSSSTVGSVSTSPPAGIDPSGCCLGRKSKSVFSGQCDLSCEIFFSFSSVPFLLIARYVPNVAKRSI